MEILEAIQVIEGVGYGELILISLSHGKSGVCAQLARNRP